MLMPKGYQYAQLMWIFDIKKEDKRGNLCLVVGSHAVDSSTLHTHSSVIQTLSIFLILLIAKTNKLTIATVDMVNERISANFGEQLCFLSVSE